MWNVVEGRMVFVPIVTHTRLALGSGRILDTLNYINREADRGR